MKTTLAIIALVFAALAYYFYDAKTKAESELARSVFEKQIIDISREKEEGIAPLKSTYGELEANLRYEIDQGQIKISQSFDRLSITIVDKILFPSGKAEITPGGSLVLERVGNILKNVRNEIIRVDGYNDTSQINRQLQNYQTNWELTSVRATNIVRFLQEKVGIDEKLLQPISTSEYRPVATNVSPDGGIQNRQIEIALLE
jgi:chemotaxis protein MotB